MKRAFSLSIAALLLFSAFSVLIGMPPTARAIDFTPTPVPITTSVNVKDSLDMAVSDDGRIYVAWTERAGDNFNMYLSHSSNNGTTFSPGAKLNTQSADSQRVGKVATANNTLYAVWEDGSNDGGDIILARSEDGGITFQEVRVSDHENGTQSNPTVAANGDRVAVAWEEYRSDNTIRIWNGVNGNLVRELAGHSKAVRDVEFSPDGTRIASGSEDNTVKIWSASGALTATLANHTRSVTAVNWSADGKMLATGSWDHNVLLLNSTTYGIIKVLNHTSVQTENYVNALSFSGDSSRLAVAYNGEYGTGTPSGYPVQNFNLTVWNMTGFSNWTRGGFTAEPNRGHTNSVMDAAFSHNGTYLASVSKDLSLKVWNSSTGQRIQDVMLGQSGQAVSWSPDDRFLAVGLGNGSIAIVNTSNVADITWMNNRHTGGVNSVDWSAVRDEIVSGASDPIVRVWDRLSRKERLNLTEHWNSVYTVDWSSSGQYIATAGGMSEQYGVKENQIFCAVSDDAGITFSSPVMVADSCAQTRLRPNIAMDSSGTISAVWYDSRNGGSHIYFANSTDGGASFNMNVGIDTISSESTTPRIFVEDSGTAHIVWQYGLGAGIRYSNSTDGFAMSRIISLIAQMPRITGSPDGSSVWITWRYGDTANSTNHIKASISYDGGTSFNPEPSSLNFTSSFLGEHITYVDVFNQTYLAWEIGESIYHRTTVLNDLWGPRIIFTNPSDGSTGVSIFTSFTVRFSEPMNRGVTEASFSWTDGASTWNVGNCEGNKGTWNAYGDTVIFKPREPLQYQKSGYSFRINSTASDLAGNLLGQNMIFAFTTSADTDPPTIEYYPSQDTVSYDQEYHVMAIIKDQWGAVDNAMLFYQGVADASPTRSILMSLSGTDTYQASIPAQQSLGTIFYFIRATDAYSNMAWNPVNYTNQSQLYAVEVVDGVRPEISHVPVVEADVFREIEIWAVVTDSIQLQAVNLNYRAIGSITYTRIIMQPFNNTPNMFRHLIPAQNTTGMVHYNITAVDASGNFNSTGFISIRIMDRIAPLINSVTPELLDNQTRVRVRANVTDDVEVGSVVLYFKTVGGDAWVSRQMTHVSGDMYEFIIPAQRRSGVVYYYVNATDSSGNQASTLFEEDQFQIEVEGVDDGISIYYVLGGILIVLMILLVLLLIRKFSDPASAKNEFPDDSGEINEPEKEAEELDIDAP